MSSSDVSPTLIPTAIPAQPRELDRALSLPRVPLILRIFEYLAFAVFAVLAALVLLFQWNHTLSQSLAQILLLAGSIAFGIFLLFALINIQLKGRIESRQNNLYRETRSELWSTSLNPDLKPTIVAARQKALGYSQELIDDYKKTRAICRNLYYSLQMTTILFSGITPILVLLDKLQTTDSWARWLPVIFPAIASIVASIVTSFPFQENWIAANATVELLEAEQEKFILGVTPEYRPPLDFTDPGIQLQRANQAIENYINQINSIHLKRVQESSNVQKNQEQPRAEA